MTPSPKLPESFGELDNSVYIIHGTVTRVPLQLVDSANRNRERIPVVGVQSTDNEAAEKTAEHLNNLFKAAGICSYIIPFVSSSGEDCTTVMDDLLMISCRPEFGDAQFTVDYWLDIWDKENTPYASAHGSSSPVRYGVLIDVDEEGPEEFIISSSGRVIVVQQVTEELIPIILEQLFHGVL